MRVFCVGGAGFIGHNLAFFLKINGHEVMCLDSLVVNNLVHSAAHGNFRYVNFIQERLQILAENHIPLIVADARDYHEMSRAIGAFKPDVIIHLAAIAHIDRSNKDPHTTFDHSLRTLENSLDVARALSSKLMYFSSSTVYGNFSQDGIDEDEPLKPYGIYGNLKAAGERMCIAYNQVYGMPVCIIRPQALYGPRCVSGRVTQVLIEQAKAGKLLTINGSGEERHDFTFIDDLSTGIDLIVKSDWHGLKIYNLTGESATSVINLAKIVVERYPAEIIYTGSDSDKPKRGTMSCARLREDTGYKPAWNIRDGMRETMRWYDAQRQ